jgi:hypothetical protein
LRGNFISTIVFSSSLQSGLAAMHYLDCSLDVVSMPGLILVMLCQTQNTKFDIISILSGFIQK